MPSFLNGNRVPDNLDDIAFDYWAKWKEEQRDHASARRSLTVYRYVALAGWLAFLTAVLMQPAKGFLVVDRVDGDFVLRQEQPLQPSDLAQGSGELKQVFLDGGLTRPTTLAETRARLAGQ